MFITKEAWPYFFDELNEIISKFFKKYENAILISDSNIDLNRSSFGKDRLENP